VVGDNLYKHGSVSGILMKCVRMEEGKEILQEIHEGMCGIHAASRTLVGKAFRSGFYWPTALADTKELVSWCTNCQFFSRQPHVPADILITIPPSWLFACWRLDIIGPLTTALGGFTHMLVATGLRDCVHNVVHTGKVDRTCPIPYLCCTLLACEVELVDTEGSYSSCTRVRFLS
jgi:hypothetical protein